MKKFIKIIKWAIISILTLILVLLAMIYYFLATDSGYKKIPALVSKYSDYTITYDELQGNLFSHQQWKHLKVIGPDLNLQLENLQLDLERNELWHRKLHFKRMLAENGHIDLSSSESEEIVDDSSFTALPDLNLPIDIVIDQLQVENFKINQDQQKLLDIVDTQLQAQLIAGKLSAQAQLNLSQDAEDDENNYQGNLTIAAELTADYPIQLDADFDIKLADLQTQKFELNVQDSVLNPTIKLTANGWLNAILRINAEIDLSQEKVDSQITWQDVDYQKGLVQSPQGEVSLSGEFDDLSAKIAVSLLGNDIPESKIDASMRLKGEVLDLQSLTIQSATGNANIQGTLSFADGLTWQATGDIDQFNVGQYVQSITGIVNSDFQTSGSLIDDNLKMDLEVKKLDGIWQKQKMQGVVSLSLDNNNINLRQFDLRLGKNSLFAKGSLDDQMLDFNFDINVVNLKDFYPDLQGSLEGKGQVTGSINKPNIEASLKGSQLQLAGISLKGMTINLDSIFSDVGEFNNQIVLYDLSLNTDTKWSIIQLDTRGSIDKHSIELKTTGGEFNTQIIATGSLHDFSDWQGSIDKLNITGFQLDMNLKHPVVTQVSADHQAVKDFCMVDHYSDVCLSLDNQEVIQIEYLINQLDTRSFAGLLPDTIKTDNVLKGSGKFTIDSNQKIVGKSRIDILPGHLILQVGDQPPVNFRIKNSYLLADITGDKGHLSADLNVDKDSHIKANAELNNLDIQPNIQGNIEILITNIAKFKNFVPDVSQLTGKLSGHMGFKGKLDDPVLDGEILLEDGVVSVPEYATDLEDIRLQLTTDDAQKIKIVGNVGTPKGALKADGFLILKPLSMQLDLKGKDMQIANSNEIKVTVSPDFNIQLLPDQGLIVKGLVRIPTASVSIPDSKSQVKASSDIVIVNREKSEQSTENDESIPIQAEIKVQLGDKVYFQNADANIRLMGSLNLLLKPDQAMVSQGRIEIASGVYVLYGQELEISRGWITFSGDISRPILDILAEREIDTITVGAHITGTPDNLKLTLTSDPSMTDTDILSYLLFGSSSDDSGGSTALLQAAASVGLKGVVPDNLAEKTGLDVFDVGVSGLKAGKYIFSNLYIGMETDFFENISTLLTRYQISKRLSIQGSAGTDENSVDAVYQFETN